MIVDAFLDRSEDDDLQQCDIILEPCSEFQERYGLLTAYSLSDLDSKVTHKVRMLNPCPHAISVNQDATLGTAEVVIQAVTLVTPNDRRATSSDMPTAGEQKFSLAENPGNCTLRRMKDQAAEVPDHLQQLLSSSCANRSDMERSRITDCLVKF